MTVAQELPAGHLDHLKATAVRLHRERPDLAPGVADFAATINELAPFYEDYVATVSAPGHAMSLRCAAYMLSVCRTLRVRRVTDLGSGFSSFVLARYASQASHPVAVTSVDTDRAWLDATNRYLTKHQLETFTTLVHLDEFERQPSDLIFHDLANGATRVTAMADICDNLLTDTGVVIFDDMHHYGHWQSMETAATKAGMNWYSIHAWTMDEMLRFACVATKSPANPLTAAYMRLCATPSDIYLHLPRFVEMVADVNARHILELGTRTGVSTVAWLHAIDCHAGGTVTSVDIEEITPPVEVASHPSWRFVCGDDLDPNVVRSIAVPIPDIVFLDTSHHYQQTRRELSLYRWVVKPGGLIVCHDTELAVPEGSPPGDPRYPVRRAIQEFTRENGFSWVNLPDCFGLGVIKVGNRGTN